MEALLGNKDEEAVFKCVAAVDKSMRFGNQSSFTQRGRGEARRGLSFSVSFVANLSTILAFLSYEPTGFGSFPLWRGRFPGAEGAFPFTPKQ